VNGDDEDFLLDTGSPITWISREIQVEQQLPVIERRRVPLAVGSVTVDFCRVDLKVFGREYRQHTVRVGDVSLLGRDVLADFTLTFNGPKQWWAEASE
jgi:hypothetical protein